MMSSATCIFTQNNIRYFLKEIITIGVNLMAKSTAHKKRAHQLRNTGKDVSAFRNEIDFSTHVRMTKTKKEKLQHYQTKHKKHFHQGLRYPDGNAFYIA